MTTAFLRLFSFNTTIQSSTNSTYLLPDYASTDSSPANNNHTPSIMETITSDNFLRVISKDIFTGQIIATVVVLVFISVFLLREWISQNARPGVFEDVDPPVEVVEGVEEGEDADCGVCRSRIWLCECLMLQERLEEHSLIL